MAYDEDGILIFKPNSHLYVKRIIYIELRSLNAKFVKILGRHKFILMEEHRLYYRLMRKKQIHRSIYMNLARLLYFKLSLWMKIMQKYKFLSKYLWIDSLISAMMKTNQILRLIR